MRRCVGMIDYVWVLRLFVNCSIIVRLWCIYKYKECNEVHMFVKMMLCCVYQVYLCMCQLFVGLITVCLFDHCMSV